MKYLKSITLLFVVLTIASCFKDKKPGETGGVLIGTFYSQNNEIYIVSDTLRGANGSEFRYYFENEEVFEGVKNETRIYVVFKYIKELEKNMYQVECLAFGLIPTVKMFRIAEDDSLLRDYFADKMAPLALRSLSVSHDFLNIGSLISFLDDQKHHLYVTRDALDQNPEKENEVTLSLYHHDEENIFPYYRDSLFYISVPIRELPPLKDTIFIRVLSKIAGQSGSSITVMYDRSVSNSE